MTTKEPRAWLELRVRELIHEATKAGAARAYAEHTGKAIDVFGGPDEGGGVVWLQPCEAPADDRSEWRWALGRGAKGSWADSFEDAVLGVWDARVCHDRDGTVPHTPTGAMA